MKYFAGFDVSLEETAIAVVDETGRMVREGKVVTEPEALDAYLHASGLPIDRIGLEAGPLSTWLYGELTARSWLMICIETRRLRAVTRAMPVKSDRKDADAIAQAMRTGWYRAVHVKSGESQRIRVLLRNRRILQAKRLDIDNEIRGTLKAFGLKIGKVGRVGFAGRVRALIAGEPVLETIMPAMLDARAALIAAFDRLHRQVLAIVRLDPVCRLLMTAPGIGAVTALGYKTAIDDPHRFRHSADLGPHLGLTPRRYQSGETDYSGRISKCGDAMVRSLLFEAAMAVLYRVKAASRLRTWGRTLSRRIGAKKAATAVARELAVVLHRMWVDGKPFNPNPLHDAAN